MSKWGLISDVHGNLPALEEAVDRLLAQGVDRLGFLGDYLGRGDSDGCVRLIRELGSAAVVGNRDLDWQDRVSPESRDWVLGLPRTVCADGLLLAHGDARLTRELSTAEVRRDFERAWGRLDACGARLFVFGHSHHARVWRKATADARLEPLRGDEWGIEDRYRYFLNVGSAGLPFPGKGGASVALVDMERRVGRILALPDLGRPSNGPALQS